MTPLMHRLLLLLLVGSILCSIAVAADDFTVDYDPRTGEYTHYWFDPTAPPNPVNMVYSFLLPIYAVLGPMMYFIMWGGFVTATWLYTQDITMPLVIGTLSGAIMTEAMDLPESQIMMVLVMCFALGGLLVKVVFGR